MKTNGTIRFSREQHSSWWTSGGGAMNTVFPLTNYHTLVIRTVFFVNVKQHCAKAKYLIQDLIFSYQRYQELRLRSCDQTKGGGVELIIRFVSSVPLDRRNKIRFLCQDT